MTRSDWAEGQAAVDLAPSASKQTRMQSWRPVQGEAHLPSFGDPAWVFKRKLDHFGRSLVKQGAC